MAGARVFCFPKGGSVAVAAERNAGVTELVPVMRERLADLVRALAADADFAGVEGGQAIEAAEEGGLSAA